MVSLKEKLLSDFEGLKIDDREADRLFIDTQKEAVLSLLSYLKKAGYNHLAMVSCTDWIDEGKFELVYIVNAYLSGDQVFGKKEKKCIVIRTKISRQSARFMTVMEIFENAEPYEREMHEMFGIDFEGHPRLTPLMLERDYKIPPFRKDFDTLNYVNNTFGKIPSIEQRKEGLK
ncbi:MAG: NADH-quinone oxidoreductase subunit C [Candidatus Marinimicrobia bacterium]|nr:NADH-quinone oxidoreductase subunit C [Candidatus Neomarinimicrobiota bacterium]